MAISPITLIPEGQLSKIQYVYFVLVNRLVGLSLPKTTFE